MLGSFCVYTPFFAPLTQRFFFVPLTFASRQRICSLFTVPCCPACCPKRQIQFKRCKKMEQKKVIRDFKVLTEKISPDNVAVMAELIIWGTMRRRRIKTFAGTFSANTSPDISFRIVTTSSKAWRYSYATTMESIWTTSCISPKEASRER